MLYVMQYLQLMQQYTNQAYNYAGYYINAVKQWWYPPEQIPQGPIEQLKFYLQNSNVEFKTKHSEQKIIIQRICMMYSQVLTGDDKKYQNFKPTIQKPLQFYQEQSTQNTLEHKQQEQQAIKKQKCLVSIQGELKIRSEKIKCSLLVTIVILPQIEDKLPLIFIRNPDAYKTQPNLLYTQPPHDIYESILGGVTLSQLELKKLQNQWKQYKAHNLLNLIKKINMLLIEYFPFVKRYSPFQTLATNSQEYKKVESLKNQFKNYLPKLQSLAILKECIQSENKHLSEQNRSLKKILENQKIGDSESFFKIFTVTQNRQLFELLSIERAYLDCIRLVQNQQLNQMYANSTQYMKTLAAKHFEAKFKIKQFIERIQANMSTFL